MGFISTFISLVCLSLAAGLTTPALAEPVHAIAMHGAPALAQDFTHFPYANQHAPKGGRLRLGVIGTFDSLNPFIIKGTKCYCVRTHTFESLMARSYDEPFSLYGLLAETIDVPDDRSSVTFTLRPEAQFSDGTPVSIADVIFSMQILRDEGRPNYGTYYSKIARIEQPKPGTVRFVFENNEDRELPLIIGLMPILPKHIYEGTDLFTKTTLQPPTGSGPYRVAQVDPGKRIVFERNQDYWGAKLAVNQGRNNFDTLVYEYFRDENTAFEAFKAGLYDFHTENNPGRWMTDYDFPAVRAGDVVQEKFATGTPSGMYALVFNTRRAAFNNPLVRQALLHLLDFEWINKNLYHGVYNRTQSFFDHSDLGSHGVAADERERALLAPYMAAVDLDILEGRHALPVSDGGGRNRANRRLAFEFLKQAGFEVRDGKVVATASGAVLAPEILVSTSEQERVALVYKRQLDGAGIEASVRLVDSSQYQSRIQSFDFDMMMFRWGASLSPGNEQSFRWSMAAADRVGSFNFPGVREPGVDAMIAAMLEARTREDFRNAVRALDRLLLSGRYVIPLFHLNAQWAARWQHIKHPENPSLYGIRLDTWWAQ